MPHERAIPILPAGMRSLVLLASLLAAGAIATTAAGGAYQNAGELSVERARGAVILEIRGSVLGRLGAGTLRVTDATPRDRFEEIVTGRRVIPEQVGPRTVVYRGVGLRFRMLGGGYRIAARGTGISLSAVGRGFVTLDGDRLGTLDAGVYSLDGVDCSVEPERCLPMPEEPARHAIEPAVEESRTRR
jgi:hypothetical protein